MSDRKHSISGPSKLWLRMICQGSGGMARAARDAGIVQPTSDAAERGNRLHKAMETGDTAGLDDSDLEWVDGALMLLQRVVGDLPLIEQEETFEFTPELGFGEDTRFGTPDRIYGHRFGEIIVVDLKSGRKPVDSCSAPQLHVIAGVKLQKLPAHGARCVIIQPPYAPVLTPFDFNVYEHARLASVDSSKPPERFQTGSHCAMCDGAAVCPFARNLALAEVLPEDATSEALAEVLDRAEIQGQVAAQAKATMKARLDPLPPGSEIRGWSLSRPRQVKVWTNEAAAKSFIEQNAPELIEHKVPSPAKAIKALGARVSDLVGTVPGARVLSKKEEKDDGVLPAAGGSAGAGTEAAKAEKPE